MYLPLVSAVIVFGVIILILVTILTIAEKKLLPQDEVKILINNDEKNIIQVKPGGTLLNALSSQSVFLPSACGGGGTCAMCKCQIVEGGGQILATELSHISRSEWKTKMQIQFDYNAN